MRFLLAGIYFATYLAGFAGLAPMFFIKNEGKIRAMAYYRLFLLTFLLYILHKNAGFLLHAFLDHSFYFNSLSWFGFDMVLLSLMMTVYSLFYTSMGRDKPHPLFRWGAVAWSALPLVLLAVALVLPPARRESLLVPFMRGGVYALSALLVFSSCLFLHWWKRAINSITGIMMKLTALSLFVFVVPFTLQSFWNFDPAGKRLPLSVENLFFAAVNLANIFILARNNLIDPLPDTNTKPEFSAREREILAMVLKGRSNKEIAFRLKITERTVINHLNTIFKKTETKNRVELIARIKADKLLTGL